LGKDDRQGRTPGGCMVSAHPMLGPHVRLHEEPERHVWRAELGTDTHAWLAEHRIRDIAVLPGAAWCEMALEAARVVLGEAAEVRDLRFVEALPLDEQTAVGASTSSTATGVAEFIVESNDVGVQSRPCTAVLLAAEDAPPAAYDIAALLAAHPRREEGAEVRGGLTKNGIQYGAAFSGLGALHISDDATGSVLAEVALPGPLRSR
ncbi:hypothetical protein C6A85_83270, partial [Mycobacterium sp. ITM-2017-0098]